MINLDYRRKVWEVEDLVEFTRVSGSYPFNPSNWNSTEYVHADLGLAKDNQLYIGFNSLNVPSDLIERLYKVRAYVTKQVQIMNRWLAEYERQELYKSKPAQTVNSDETSIAQMMKEGYYPECYSGEWSE